MDSESNGEKESEVSVKYLQATLFPPQITNSSSYFSNFFVKTTQFVEDDDGENKLKLRESLSFRELFISNKEANFTLQAPRWPTECQVLEEKIEHINYIPPSLEAYYPVTGSECQPKPSGEECGIVVYQYQPISAVNYFSRSSVGGSSYLLASNICPEEDSLKFESRFESGNLARAIRITPNYYELHLRADLYTNRHMQWFYFRVTNMKKAFLYRFSITNCSKESSLYNEGMKPLMYSKKDSQLHCIGWRRCGQNISYFCNDNVTPEDPDQQMTYTLTFTVEFPHDDDEVYLAHCYPYTYSDLQNYLQELSSHPVKTNFCNVRLLCKSLAGNNVYFVTITSPVIPGEIKKKRAVVITARVHPGETPSSWMMKGILDFLSGDSSPAKELRDNFIFKIVPMLNPDGVIVGNNRCSLSAKDLNRQYRTVMRDTYPSIWYTKLMVRRLLEECGVALYCDLHAHSRKHNIFIYGCENRRGADRRLQEQVFPLMLHKNTAEKFSFESCKFRIQKAKEGTGRVVMWMMGIANSYTMEASFSGSALGNRTDTHFNTQDYEQMGRTFCQTLLDFYDEDPRKERLRNKIIDRLTQEGSNADEPTNIPLSDYSSDDGDTSSSSDEVGRDEEENEIIIPTPPPPSPVLVLKKPKPKSSPTRRVLSRSPCAPRKPLPVNRQYDLELRDYSQQEIDNPDIADGLREQPIFWIKQPKPQHAVVVNVAAAQGTTLNIGEQVSHSQLNTSGIYELGTYEFEKYMMEFELSNTEFSDDYLEQPITWKTRSKPQHAVVTDFRKNDNLQPSAGLICKATLKLSLSEKECLGSSSDSESEMEKVIKEKVKIFRKRRKKKKIVKKKSQPPAQDYSDSELQNMEKSQNQHGLSVFDLIPTEKLRSQLLTQRSKTPQPKILTEKRNEVTKQLAEVQAKLYTLKNKLWFGVGNGDAPLSWGSGRFYYSNNSRSTSPQKFSKKASKKKSQKQDKADKATKKENKAKAESKEKAAKNQNGLRRQVAVEWSVSVDNLKIRKSKSLPDSSSYSLALESKIRNENDTRDKKKKKKKPNNSKFAKKAKAVTNAKSFTQKD